VLVLHGGASDSQMKVAPLSLAVLRLIPVARAMARQVPDVAVYRLRFSVRGWNGDGAGVLADARWALELIEGRQPGVPVVLVGHSLGGRVALHLAGADGVAGAVGLAPWAEPGDPVDRLNGVPLAIVHGSADRMIPEPSTRAWLAAATAAGAVISSTLIDGGGHAMLRHWRRWHRLAAAGVGMVLSSSVRGHAQDSAAARGPGRRAHPAQPSLHRKGASRAISDAPAAAK
jgi:dienelactone hydrolase